MEKRTLGIFAAAAMASALFTGTAEGQKPAHLELSPAIRTDVLAGSSYNLYVDTIAGPGANGAIALDSFSFGETQTGTAAFGGGAGAGKVSMQDLHVTHVIDSTSPKLFQACASGVHLTQVRLEVTAGAEVRMKVTLRDVMVSSVTSGGDATRSTENVSFNYSQIAFDVSTVHGGWDVKLNRAL